LMDWWNTPIRSPYYFLIVGLISFSAAVASTCAGKTYGRYGGWASRAKEPTDFWWTVAIYYFGGVCFIGYFLYKVYGLSN
jgi:hypothetical protein